jgi:hypothetical protein
MKLFIWKARFAFYMWKRSDLTLINCFRYAEASIENNPDDIWEDGPIYYAQEEMACWSD